jgi:hypothetical protein
LPAGSTPGERRHCRRTTFQSNTGCHRKDSFRAAESQIDGCSRAAVEDRQRAHENYPTTNGQVSRNLWPASQRRKLKKTNASRNSGQS